MSFCSVCGTWGTYGALISKLDTARYKFFVFLNSGVRGPFLPTYIPVSCCTSSLALTHLFSGVYDIQIMQALLPWHRLLTLQLAGEVHLLGPVLSCQASVRNDTGQQRSNPYVLAHVVAVDQVTHALHFLDHLCAYGEGLRLRAVLHSARPRSRSCAATAPCSDVTMTILTARLAPRWLF